MVKEDMFQKEDIFQKLFPNKHEPLSQTCCKIRHVDIAGKKISICARDKFILENDLEKNKWISLKMTCNFKSDIDNIIASLLHHNEVKGRLLELPKFPYLLDNARRKLESKWMISGNSIVKLLKVIIQPYLMFELFRVERNIDNALCIGILKFLRSPLLKYVTEELHYSLHCCRCDTINVDTVKKLIVTLSNDHYRFLEMINNAISLLHQNLCAIILEYHDSIPIILKELQSLYIKIYK